MQYLDYHPDDIDVRVSELLTATVDAADPLLHPKVGEALRVLRDHMDMDVVFVSQFHDRKRTFKVVERRGDVSVVQAGLSDPLEKSWCHFIVEGRAPQFIKDAAPMVADGTLPEPGFTIGTHLSTPIVLQNGEVYGTLCCFSGNVKEGVSEMDLKRLQITAKLLASDLLDSGIGADLKLEPMSQAGGPARKFEFAERELPKQDFAETEKIPPGARDKR